MLFFLSIFEKVVYALNSLAKNAIPQLKVEENCDKKYSVLPVKPKQSAMDTILKD